MKINVREIALMAVCTSILFVQEQTLTFLPNIQFSTMLIVLYSRIFSFKKSTLIILMHIFLDNLYMGSIAMFNIVIPMTISWMLIPVFMNTVFKNTESPKKLAIGGYVFGHIYGWMFIPFQVFMMGIPFKVYFIADIPWEIMMGISNFVTILWLYEPLKNNLRTLLKSYAVG